MHQNHSTEENKSTLPNPNCSLPNNTEEDTSTVKHRHSPQCLNKCIKWKLLASIKHKNGAYSYSFPGNSLYFKKLEASILNILQNNYLNNNERSPTKNCLKAFTENSAMQLSSQGTNNQNNKAEQLGTLHDYLNIKFPINNTDFNFLIIDANLGIADNLQNIFFLEFDLNTTNKGNNKESLKFFKEINDSCVDREIDFTLNGTLHDTPLFKSDLKFTVEYKKFIKSIQFRIQSYQNQVNKKKYNHNGNWKGEKKGYYSRSHFYAKILLNINLGIEFTKPNNDGCENYHTNFNSIVNSNIQISKLYLEVCIPKMLINNNINLTSIQSTENQEKDSKDKSKENDGVGLDNATQSIVNNSNHINASLNTDNKVSNSDYQTGNSVFNVPRIPFQNDLNRMLYKQQNSPTMTIRNNLSLNSKYNYNFNGSPLFVKPMNGMLYSPQGYMNPMMPPFIPGIPTIPSSNGIPQPPPMYPFQYQGQRKLSENLYEKIKENPLSKMSGTFCHTPIGIPIHNDQIISGIQMNNTFVSPRDMHKIPVNMQGANIYIPMNSMIQTISQKIIDWENSNTTDNQKIETKLEYKKQFFKEFNERSNYHIFIKASTPNVYKSQSEFISQMSLMKYIGYFTNVSLFGLDISYYIDDEITQCVYSCTLSSFKLLITSEDDVNNILLNLQEKGFIRKEEINDDLYKDIEPDDLNANLNLKVTNKEITIEYFESKLPHVRCVFLKQFEQIIRLLNRTIGLLTLRALHCESWYSILWSPIKSHKSALLTSSFLTYYNFNPDISQSSDNRDQYQGIPLIGIIPIKFNNSIFLTKIRQNSFIDHCDTLNLENPSIAKQMLDNVLNVVIKNSLKTSIDFDFYLKSSNK